MTDDVRLTVTDFKRSAGYLLARFSDLKLQLLQDSRRAAGKRWKLAVVLRTALLGMMAGCQSVADVEALTANMSRRLRQMLGIARRLPDSTLRAILVRLEPNETRKALHALIHAAWRRKALPLAGFPFHVLSLDGKATSVPNWDNEYSQRQTYDDGRQAHGMVRMVNACLISTEAKPVIDTHHIPACTNEMGAFPLIFDELLRSYGRLFQVVTYDAGVPSEENCRLVVDAGKDFNFRIKNENWHLYREAVRRLGSREPATAAAASEDLVAKRTGSHVVRRVFVCTAPSLSFVWSTVKTLVRVQVQHVENGNVTSTDDKYYISSLAQDALSGEQWLGITRGHWGVENNVHWVLDAIFREDERPWIETAPQGTVVVNVLRRIACALLALFRTSLKRRDDERTLPWRPLLDWVYRTVVAVSADVLEELRPRRGLFAAS
jgi:predicted transposase YbfD/YdcC